MNSVVTYEIGYYTFDHEIIFTISKAENMQNSNF